MALTSFIGLKNAYEILKKAKAEFFILAILFQFLNVFLVSYKIKFLVESAGEKIRSFSRVYLITLSGNFINNITPGARVGGEAAKIYLLNKEFEIPANKAAAAIFGERVFDFFALFGLFILGYFYAINKLRLPEKYSFAIKLTLILSIFILIFVLKVIKSRRIKRFSSYFPERFSNSFESFRVSYADMLEKRSISAYAIIISIAIWLTEILRAYFVFLSLNYHASFIIVAIANIIGIFLTTIPLTPGGAGVVEAGVVGIYIAADFDKSIAALAVIADRVIAFWLMSIAGVLALLFLTKQK